ncbi:allophanate hydrolase subunit 1 [Microbacterium sp. P03]|uniref:5-oxoprolinase subunit B family protein n=1 Tax=Microbacterium sp. P03 TaxID=3366946 RepID=UPI0037450C50
MKDGRTGVTTPVLLPMGERAVLAELPSLSEVLALHARLMPSRPGGVVDLVPAARTVLVSFDPAQISATAVRAWIGSAPESRVMTAEEPARVVTIDVRYDGADLADTALLLGITPPALIDAHRTARWTVAFTGFAPGFGYLVSADWTFDVPRLPTPRTHVPPGAVGLAGEFTGAYPRATPGGWRLIGSTTARLFDPDASSPTLLAPGMSVRFRRVDEP